MQGAQPAALSAGLLSRRRYSECCPGGTPACLQKTACKICLVFKMTFGEIRHLGAARKGYGKKMEPAAFSFLFAGKPLSCDGYGSGHINTTYLIKTDQGASYILQRINCRVFGDVPGLMQNIQDITGHLWKKTPDPRRVLSLVPTRNGAVFAMDEGGSYWRAYAFVENSACLEKARSARDFYQSGVAFGQFQSLLRDFPAHRLKETIPKFHDTIRRYVRFRQVLAADPMGRADGVREEAAFALSRAREAETMVHMLRDGRLPLRVTHNDAKLNNVLLDAQTGEALCVIDLDTVMPGLCGNDFGDSIRFGASTAAEDEPDLSLVSLSLPLFEAYSQGFLLACGDHLTPPERETLPLAAKLMTLECGLRFLTDYLEGDVYFRIHRPAHNLDRCRTQFALVKDMEQKYDAMREIILS